MAMTSTQDDDPFYGSDDELPSLDALLTRIPGRIKQQLSQPKPISKHIPKNAIWIELEDDDSSVENQTTDKEDFIYDLSDAEPEKAIPALVKGEVRKRWQSSSERFGDDDLKGEGKRPSRSLGQSISTQKPKSQEVDIRSRKTTNTKNNVPSRIESQASIKQPRGPSETSNGASRNTISNASGSTSRLPQSQTSTSERSRYNSQGGPLTQHPRSVSPSRSRITKSSRQPQLPKHQEGKDIIRPLSELLPGIQDGLGANTLRFPIIPPKESKQKKLGSPHRDIHAKEAPQGLVIDTVRLQEFDDEWDESEMDRKTKSSTRSTVPKSPSKRQTKKSFDAKKSQLAIDFLQQLDTQITHGKVGELTQSTGGVKIVWSNTLKTTAGRANWKRETIISKHIGDSAKADVKQYRHHSSIELSEKVIDDELRLLNVIAHEFCHLANFMINGITDNPHGKEFKVWAAKCTQLFGSQGIKVTTKHSYEIDFKYVWTCTACGCEYKRHSKSIDPKRHRCGACKASLEQTKPTPRQTPTGQLSEYQLFVKEQMKIVKSEHPNSPQKEIMGIIAERWTKVNSKDV
ncbi:SprT-like family domain-containing protein [Trichoderma afarasin]